MLTLNLCDAMMKICSQFLCLTCRLEPVGGAYLLSCNFVFFTFIEFNVHEQTIDLFTDTLCQNVTAFRVHCLL
jgi:hypothetical protein